MIAELIAERAAENLEATYVAVGSQGDAAQIEKWEGGVACLSKLGHPVSNFAVVRFLSPTQAQEVFEFAAGRRAFNVYVLGSEVETSLYLLGRLGFRLSGRLSMMIGEGFQESSSPALAQAFEFEDRLQVCRFMARQFFPRQTSTLREAIALATARAPVELFCQPGKNPLAAAMIHATNGMAGIYNVCVSSNARERGFGTELLASLLRKAKERNLLATLQCESNLEPWYSRRGFESVGSISVLSLDRKASHAIM